MSLRNEGLKEDIDQNIYQDLHLDLRGSICSECTVGTKQVDKKHLY